MSAQRNIASKQSYVTRLFVRRDERLQFVDAEPQIFTGNQMGYRHTSHFAAGAPMRRTADAGSK